MSSTRLALMLRLLIAAALFLRLGGVTWLPAAPWLAGALLAWTGIDAWRGGRTADRLRVDWYAIGLAALVVATIAARLPSIGADLGRQPPDIDGHRLGASIRHFFVTGSIAHDTVEHYPGIVFWAMSATSLLTYLWGLMRGTIRAIEMTPVEHFMLAARLTNVAIAAATVACAAGIARTLSGRGAALAAASVVAFAPLAIETTTDTRNDPGQVLLLVAAALAAVRGRDDSTDRWILGGGVLAGLATGVKYTSVFVLVPVLLAAFAAPEGRRLRRSVLAIAAFAVALATSNHFLWWDFPNFVRQLSDQVAITGRGHWAASSNPAAAHRIVLATVGAGWPLLVIAAAWGAWELATGRRRAWLFWSFPLLYSWFTTHRPSQFARWVYPLLPFVAVAGACGLAAVAGAVMRGSEPDGPSRSRSLRAAIAGATVALTLGPPLWGGAVIVSRRLTPSTAMQLEQWLEQRVPPDRVVLVEDGWLDLRQARFTVLRVPDLARALAPDRYVSSAADFVVVPETHFSDLALSRLALVTRLDASRRFGGSLGFDYRVYEAPRAAPVDRLELRLDAPESDPALGPEWGSRADRRSGLALPDKSAVVYLPPLAPDGVTVDVDLLNAGDAAQPVPIVMSIVTAGDRKVSLTDAPPVTPGVRRLQAHLPVDRPGRGIVLRLDPIRRGARLRVVAISVAGSR